MAEQHVRSDDYLSRALEVSIHVGLLILLAAACLLILYPFLPIIAWGIIIAIAAYPGYRKLQSLLGGRSVLAAVVCTALLFTLLIVPVALLAGSLIQGVQNLAAHFRDGTSIIPPPPTRIETWPIVGLPLKRAWDLASANLTAALQTLAPQVRAVIPKLFFASAAIGLAVVEWVLSILVAGILLANASAGAKVAHSLATRILGDRGPEFEELASATIRSVTVGIVGVALIQSVLAALGFLAVGLPGAGLWGVIFLVAAVLQLGGLVLILPAIYVIATASATKAVIFLAWCLFVAVIDNILKPLLLGRGVAVPMAVVFLGAIGGFVALGIIGLFVGAIVLSVGYKLFLAWLEGNAHASPEMWKTRASA